MVARLAIAALLLLPFATPTRGETPPKRPRLVVLISIDQFRADYLTRFEDLYLPAKSGRRVGGFRYLMERGANYVDAHHEHLPVATGPGHANLLTGAPPYKSGIVGNNWYDRERRQEMYCVQDDAEPFVPLSANHAEMKMKGVSARNLLVTTVGDELKIATGGKSKVFGIALKDRAAVLMAGHMADGVYWFNDTTGGWETSRYYRKDGTLPQWVRELNADRSRGPSSYLGREWTLSDNVTPEVLQRLWVPPGKDRATYAGTYADDMNVIGKGFPHRVASPPPGGSLRPFQSFTGTPFANEFVFHSATRLVEAEALGKDETPDILAINLSTNDYIGHAFGPDSAEVLDVTVKTDRQLSAFLNNLDRLVPGGLANITVALTADHGIPSSPVLLRDSGIPAGNWKTADVQQAAEEALEREFPSSRRDAGTWVIRYIEPYLWLNHETIAARRAPPERVRQVAADAMTRVTGIYAAYTREQILSGALPRTEIARIASVSYHPQISGDVLIVSRPFWFPRTSERGVTHAEPYAYDSRVPLLLAGFGTRAGTYAERVSMIDLAPTLSHILRVTHPGASEGRILIRGLAAP